MYCIVYLYTFCLICIIEFKEIYYSKTILNIQVYVLILVKKV